MAVKNTRSALMALVAAGGMWAWQNRDKIQGWINSQSTKMGNTTPIESHRKDATLTNNTYAGSTQPYTDSTRRIGSDLPTDINNPTQTSNDPFKAGI